MSRQVHTEHDTSGSVEAVFAVLTGLDWADHKAAALGDGSTVVERVELPGGGVRLVLARELPPGAPGFLERFLPRDVRIVQSDEWGPAVDGVRRGTWSVSLPGAPARLGGTLRLEPTPTGTRYTIDGEVKVSVPLIGGKAESFVADMVTRLAAKEAEVLQATLTAG